MRRIVREAIFFFDSSMVVVFISYLVTLVLLINDSGGGIRLNMECRNQIQYSYQFANSSWKNMNLNVYRVQRKGNGLKIYWEK